VKNYNLAKDEIILYNCVVQRDDLKGNINLTLTKKKMILEQEKVTNYIYLKIKLK